MLGHIEHDPGMKVDRLVSGMLEFFQGTATFTCATQLVPYQRVNIFGTSGRFEIEIPFNAPPDRPCRAWVQIGTSSRDRGSNFDACDQTSKPTPSPAT